MVQTPRYNRIRCFGLCVALSSICLLTQTLHAQQLPHVNYLLDARQAPGEVAAAQVLRRQPGVGTFQALSIRGPENLKVALVRDGQFLEPLDVPVTTGMLVGSVYRFRVTNIPFQPGQELYPTIEIIDRIYAPAGKEHRFPIPIVLTAEDMANALSGALVTRVIYLEDSELAEPTATTADQQLTTDVGPTDNALQVADQLGRPVAILRIGSRVPTNLNGDLMHFTYGSPPWIPLPPLPEREKLIQQGQWPEAVPAAPVDQPYSEPALQDYPRTP